TIEAACELAAERDLAEALVRNAIDGLAAKSFISTISDDAATCYRLLDTTRAYASVKLRERGEANDICRKHANNVCRLLKRDARTQSGLGENDLSQYRPHIGNIRAALDWAFSEHGDSAIGVQLAASAAPLLIKLSLLEECRRY